MDYFSPPTKEQFMKKVKEKIKYRQFIIGIETAYGLAEYGHSAGIRDNGEPYFTHPLGTAWIALNELNFRNYRDYTTVIIAALLHDLIEESFLAQENQLHFIFDQINPKIATIVHELTKPKNLIGVARFNRTLRTRLLLTKVVKSIDRLDNMRDLTQCRNINKMIKIVAETEDLILPWLRISNRDKNISYVIKKIEEEIKYAKDYIAKHTLPEYTNELHYDDTKTNSRLT